MEENICFTFWFNPQDADAFLSLSVVFAN